MLTSNKTKLPWLPPELLVVASTGAGAGGLITLTTTASLPAKPLVSVAVNEKLECHHCHGGFNFTQSTSHEKQLIDRRPFHNTGLYQVINETTGNLGYPKQDIGLAEISTLAADDGRFRAPTLRNIEVSAPYMHDGSIATLSEVLDFYAAGGRNITSGENQGDGRLNPLKSPFVKGFEMTEQDKEDLIAFLKTLTDNTFLTNPKHAKP